MMKQKVKDKCVWEWSKIHKGFYAGCIWERYRNTKETDLPKNALIKISYEEGMRLKECPHCFREVWLRGGG